MSVEQRHVLGFSPDGKFCAIVDEQGILRIWDTETSELKQEYIPNLHISKFTTLTWLTIATKEDEKPSRRSSDANNKALYIAFGTIKGHVSLYSFAEGKIERTLKGSGHNGKVTAIAYDHCGKLYTTGLDCQVIVWSIRDEKQFDTWQVGPEKPKSIEYLPTSKSLAIGSRQIKIFGIEQKKLLQTFAGHSSEINFMCNFIVNCDVEYLLTTSQMERIICLWKIGKKGRNKTAACTLLMEDIAYSLTCHAQDDGALRIASVTRSGVIHIYLFKIDDISSEKPIKPKATIEIASDSATVIESIPAITAHFVYDCHKPLDILFGYGSKRMLVFEHLTPNFNEKVNVLVRTDPKKLYETSRKKGGRNEAGSEAALKSTVPIIRYNQVEYRTGYTSLKKKLENDVPMESRLQNLNLNSDGESVIIQSRSKVQLLVQALHSKDADLLRSVLCIKDVKTIELTLQRLPVQYVSTLVNELTLLMQTKRVNVEFAMLWLKFITHTHASQLLALGAEDLLNKFGPCLGIIEHRVNCLKEVSKLNGRLNLLISRLNQNKDDHLNEEQALVFVDKVDEAEENNDENEDVLFETDVANDSWSDGEKSDDDDDDDDGGDPEQNDRIDDTEEYDIENMELD